MAQAAEEISIPEEDRLRGMWYALLGRLLAKPADQEVLGVLSRLGDDDSEIGQALHALKAAAAATRVDQIEQEYFDLFVGVGASELMPYGSYYLTGFLHEKPLARLRGEMRRLDIARTEGVAESEDHIAALCEMMAGLITGQFGTPADLATQRQFFDDHSGCWAPRFFENLQAAPSAVFYMPVGTLGRLFMAVESQAFEMAA